MDGPDLAFAGIARQAELIRAGDVSSGELTSVCLERIEAFDPKLNAFTIVLAERALREAEEADRMRSRGEAAALLGVPVAVKDIEHVEGVVTGFGTGAFDEPASADGELVRRLRAAGAVIIGKTALPELAICGFTESERWGVTRNPWDTERTPGGSSGGSAVAVAAGMVGGATASDGAGSIRIPAAFCGLFGLKPQRGRLPLDPPDHWWDLSVHGCLTRRVLDTAVFLDATAGHEGPAAAELSYADAARTSPARMRIAISDRPARTGLPPIVSDAARRGLAETADLLSALGHDVRRQDPRFGLAGTNFVPRYLRGIHDEIAELPHPERLEARTRGFGRLGGLYALAFVRRARRAADADAERINRVFESCDVLVTPTVGELPIELGRWRGKGALRTALGMSRSYCFTPIWNHTGQPAAAVPAGFTDSGLPLSVTLVGRPGDEPTLLSLAAQIEAERPWADRRPPLS